MTRTKDVKLRRDYNYVQGLGWIKKKETPQKTMKRQIVIISKSDRLRFEEL